MTGRKLIGMLVVFAVLAVIAVFQRSGSRSAEVGRDQADTLLFEGIDLRSITSIEVKEGTNMVSLALRDGQWVVASLYDYPVDFDRLTEAIRSAAERKLGSPERAGNVDEAEYGFGPDARRITFLTGSETNAFIEVGAKRQGSELADYPNEYFVRRNGSRSIFLVDYDFEAYSSINEDWVDRQLVDVRENELIEVRAGSLVLRREESGWMLEGMDPETEAVQPEAVTRLASALQRLALDSVADPSRTDEELGFDEPESYLAKTGDGRVYAVTLGGETEEGRYARFAVSFEPPEPPVEPEIGAGQEQLDAYGQAMREFESRTAAGRDAAREQNDRLSPWTYRISPYNAERMVADRDALVQAETSADAAALPEE